MAIRNYSSYDDHELRRALSADPDDIDAVMEAAKRFEKHEFEVPVECPECGHEWDEAIDTNDFV